MKRKFSWHWLLCILFIAIGCFLPTDTAKADIRYLYDFDEKEQAYYIYHIYATEKDEVFELPSRYNGYPVVGISDTSMDMKTKNYIKKLIIPSGYKEIGSTFSCCENLEEVVINAELSSIEKGMFSGCSKLKKINIPKSVKKIGTGAFTGTAIKTITIPEHITSIGDDAFSGCDNLYQIIFEGNTIKLGKSILSKSYYYQGATIVAKKNSDAYEYAKKNGYLVSDSTKLKVELNGTKMFVGEKKQLTVYNNPYPIKWKSSKKSVITFDKYGFIVAKKTGKATITATINGKKYKYKITVVKRTEKNVLDIAWKNYVTKDMSDYEKIVAANKFLCENVEYDTKNFLNNTIPARRYTAKGALEDGLAVCDGYAKAYYKIIDHYNIPIQKVVGTADGLTGWGGHAWLLVKIGTRWYHVDPTWNDGGGYMVTSDYLLISDKQMKKDHKWSSSYPNASTKAPDRELITLNSSGAKLSTNSETIYVGKSTTIKVTGTKKKVTWSSSNSKVASVTKNGKITGKKAGTAKIYCKIGGKKYTIKITVQNPYLNQTKVNMIKGGKTFTLKLTGATAKKYTSSNKAVVSVSKKGVLTAKKTGTATISVKDSNGKTHKCKVTVKAYSLNTTKKSLGEGDSCQLSIKGLPKNTPINWTSSDWSVAYVDANGLVTAKKNGTATISATVDGAVYKCKITSHYHTGVWKAESSTSGATAKQICTGCNKVICEGVQLVDSKGNKFYGKWNTDITTRDMLDYWNPDLLAEGYNPMVQDKTIEANLTTRMVENLSTLRERTSAGFSDLDGWYLIGSNAKSTLTIEDVSWPIDFMRPMEGWKDDNYEHRFGMIVFTWDVYGDGSRWYNLCIMLDELRSLD